MNKNLIIAALFAATSASASMTINGTYEGTATSGGAATYAQDLDLTLVGSNDIAKVTVMMENLTGGSTVAANQVFVESAFEGLSFKGGNYKSLNGSGLLQKRGSVTNQMEAGFNVEGAGITLGQASGDGNASVDVSASVAGIDAKVQNATESNRFVTVVANFFGFGTTVETQETTVGRNVAVSANADIAVSEGTSIDVTGVYMDVKDPASVTQDDGILGDISDATGTVQGAVATVGGVTGKYVIVNDKSTITGEVKRGVWTLGHSKTEDANGVTTAKIEVSF